MNYEACYKVPYQVLARRINDLWGVFRGFEYWIGVGFGGTAKSDMNDIVL